MGKYTLGRVPKHEEPDTVLIGADGTFFARVVGRPGHPADSLAVTMAESLDVAHETGRTPRQLAEERAKLLAALAKIERWFGEFPDVPDRTRPGETISYGFAYGSNGERDFMRGIARAAIADAEGATP